MNLNRRNFLGLLASVAASPALAKLPVPVAKEPTIPFIVGNYTETLVWDAPKKIQFTRLYIEYSIVAARQSNS